MIAPPSQKAQPPLAAPLLAAALLTLLASPHLAAADIEVTTSAQRAIPISLAGFSPEAQRILEFDLSVVGFEIVKSGATQFQLNAIPGAEFAAELKDGAGSSLFRRAYPGGQVRAQCHTLADQVVQSVSPNQKPIARTKIAYRTRTGRGSEIYVADYDGANAIAMTQDGSEVAGPAWVPGASKLVYTSWRLNNPDIYLHDLRSGERSAIVRYSGSNLSPAPSPDGRQLAMIMSKSGSPDVWVSTVTGGDLRRLTTSREDESSPCWSPNGQTLCFTSRMDGRPALYTLSPSGGAPKRLDTGGIVNATEPDWSPDGQWIAFTRSAGGSFQICVVPAKGGATKILREGEDPTWSPNSRTLMFVRRSGDRRTLSLLDVPTNRVKDLSLISGSCSQPSWAR